MLTEISFMGKISRASSLSPLDNRRSFLDGAELLSCCVACCQLIDQLGAITDIHFERSMLELLGLLTMHIDAGQTKLAIKRDVLARRGGARHNVLLTETGFGAGRIT